MIIGCYSLGKGSRNCDCPFIFCDKWVIEISRHINKIFRKRGFMIMEDILNYVKPELLVVAIVLYFIGMWIKQSEAIKNKFIPLILGVVSIFICGIWVMATSSFATAQDIAMAIFSAITQGILVAGLSTYADQFVKQLKKDE